MTRYHNLDMLKWVLNAILKYCIIHIIILIDRNYVEVTYRKCPNKN